MQRSTSHNLCKRSSVGPPSKQELFVYFGVFHRTTLARAASALAVTLVIINFGRLFRCRYDEKEFFGVLSKQARAISVFLCVCFIAQQQHSDCKHCDDVDHHFGDCVAVTATTKPRDRS